MCGIVGARNDWLMARGLDPATALREAVAALAWRGPDGEGVTAAGPWWLGCARLAITQAQSRQPVVRRGGRYVGVLNGAITNARELWTRWLPRAERRPAPPNDAWLPLLAVARGERERLATLQGHHAYAVVDTATGELLLGQDRYGEKPLFCVVARVLGRPTLVAFASTIAALRPFGIAPSASTRRLAELFRFGWAKLLPERCSARLRIEPPPHRGEPLRIAAATDDDDDATAHAAATWFTRLSPPPAPTPTTPMRGSLRAELTASVARCVDTSVGVGLSLSGGLDSSCLALALRDLGRSVPAYQLHARGTPNDERRAAVAVAMRAGLPLRPIDVGPELAHELPVLTALAGAPLGDPSVLALFAVARAAADDGVRVLLGGEGADELLLGYRRYRALAKLPRWPWLRGALPRWSMHYGARWLRAAAAPDPALALLAVTPPAFADAVLAPELARRACWQDRRSHERTTGPHAPTAPHPVLAARDLEIDHYLRCDLLPKADVATMAAGLEARCPYLEGRVADFGRELAALGKAPLRAAFAADLPPEVLQLPKRGFGLPLDRWFRGELPWLDLLAETKTQQRPHLRPGGVARAVDLHRRRSTDLGHGLYLLVAVELYLRCIERGFPDVVRTEAQPVA